MSKSLSTFCAASLENVSSVSGLHSLSEAVLFLSLTLFGLVSSKHFIYLLEDWIRKRFSGQTTLTDAANKPKLRFYTMTSYIIHDKAPFCQELFEIFSLFLKFLSFFIAKAGSLPFFYIFYMITAVFSKS